MVLKVCGYYWINVSPIKEIIIRYLCTFNLTLKRSSWRVAAAASPPRASFISCPLNAPGTGENRPNALVTGFGFLPPFLLLPSRLKGLGCWGGHTPDVGSQVPPSSW